MNYFVAGDKLHCTFEDKKAVMKVAAFFIFQEIIQSQQSELTKVIKPWKICDQNQEWTYAEIFWEFSLSQTFFFLLENALSFGQL